MYTNGFTLNTNMASLLVQRNFNNATNDISVLMEHLSTNMRVNRSSDDPSGMALSNNLRKQISSIAVAKTNSQTGVSMLQTAEGDLNTIKDKLGQFETNHAHFVHCSQPLYQINCHLLITSHSFIAILFKNI